MVFSDWVNERFLLPEPEIPDLGELSPEQASESLRGLWGLGIEKAPNLFHLLEAHGVRVFSLAEECLAVDAFSFWREGAPFVFLNTVKSGERSRMDAAHELGHLVLHRYKGTQGREKEAESEAALFASAFLMPRDAVLQLAPQLDSLKAIIAKKSSWDTSAASIIYRLHKLGVLSDWRYRTLYIELASLGFGTEEPNPIARESSEIIRQVLIALEDDGYTRSRISDEIHLPRQELDKLLVGLIDR